MKKIALIACLFLLLQTACRKEKFEVYTPDLHGTWKRIGDDNSTDAGLEIEIYNNKGKVINSNPSSIFFVNSEKWRNIYPIRDSIFSYEDLGSDGRFYKGQIRYKIMNDTAYLHCIILNNSPGLGRNQSWIKL